MGASNGRRNSAGVLVGEKKIITILLRPVHHATFHSSACLYGGCRGSRHDGGEGNSMTNPDGAWQ